MCSKGAEARLARIAALIDTSALVLGVETRARVLRAGWGRWFFFEYAAPLGEAALGFWLIFFVQNHLPKRQFDWLSSAPLSPIVWDAPPA